MKLPIAILVLTYSFSVSGQGTFQNLNFESANPVSTGNPGSTQVTFASALPGWTGYLGSTETTVALYNDETLGNASIDLFGPGSPTSSQYIIEGQYTVALQPGMDPFGSGQYVSASISQTALVPANTESLEFKADVISSFSVSLGGQNLSLSAWGTGPNYTLYAANIPFSEAGQVEALTITVTGNFAVNTFDSFAFSTTAVPEPNPLALTGVGTALFALYHRFAPKRP